MNIGDTERAMKMQRLKEIEEAKRRQKNAKLGVVVSNENHHQTKDLKNALLKSPVAQRPDTATSKSGPVSPVNSDLSSTLSSPTKDSFTSPARSQFESELLSPGEKESAQIQPLPIANIVRGSSSQSIHDSSAAIGAQPAPAETKEKVVEEKLQNIPHRQDLSLVYDPTSESQAPHVHIRSEGGAATSDPPSTGPTPLITCEQEKFVTMPCPQGKKYLARIYRRRDGVEKLYPSYEVFLEHPGGSGTPEFLLSARKRKKSKNANYQITTCQNSKVKEHVVGKVRSNFLGTTFTIFDGGYNPFKEDADAHKIPGQNVRKEIAAVVYDTNVLGLKGPRKMTVLVPAMTKTGEAYEFRPTEEKETMVERFKNHDDCEMLILKNKNPQWNEDSQSYVLNFSGRVTVASVKNFQIVHENDPDYIIMQFGRVEDDVFTMDFQYPLSPLQAFGIALSSFDAKLACE